MIYEYWEDKLYTVEDLKELETESDENTHEEGENGKVVTSRQIISPHDPKTKLTLTKNNRWR